MKTSLDRLPPGLGSRAGAVPSVRSRESSAGWGRWVLGEAGAGGAHDVSRLDGACDWDVGERVTDGVRDRRGGHQDLALPAAQAGDRDGAEMAGEVAQRDLQREPGRACWLPRRAWCTRTTSPILRGRTTLAVTNSRATIRRPKGHQRAVTNNLRMLGSRPSRQASRT